MPDPIEVSKGRISGNRLDEQTDVPISGALAGIAKTSIFTMWHSELTFIMKFLFSLLEGKKYFIVSLWEGKNERNPEKNFC